jgi:hypothetical protein
VVVERKPVPFTVRVICPVPAATVVGVMEVTVGVTAGCVGKLVFDEDPPHPARRANAKREK